MKRKLVQHGKSTLIVSLPSKWVQKNELKKGDEITFEEIDGNLKLSSGKPIQTKEGIKLSFDVSGMSTMIPRYIFAMYKKGIDTIELKYDSQETFQTIKSALGKETIGYEIVDQKLNMCTIQNVSGEFVDFDMILKKILLLLYTQGTEVLESIKSKDKTKLKTTLDYEYTNNTFTTICRRYLNKQNHASFSKTGPLYYILEDLENIADQFKYIANYLMNLKKFDVSDEVFELFTETNQYVKDFFELFYRFDKKYISSMKNKKAELLEMGTMLLEKTNNEDTIVVHYLLTVVHKIFCLLGPYMINIV